jgi:hypothetical protein
LNGKKKKKNNNNKKEKKKPQFNIWLEATKKFRPPMYIVASLFRTFAVVLNVISGQKTCEMNA